MKALVTGASGFLGAHLAGTLLDVGDDVISIQHDRLPLTPADVLGIYDEVTWCDGDIRDTALIKRILSDYDVRIVYHCAALPIVKMGQRSCEAILDVNTVGTIKILEAIRDLNSAVRIEELKKNQDNDDGIGFVMLSTDKVYGPMLYNRPYLETDPLEALAPYETSKACADLIARMYYAMDFIKNVIVFRPSNQFGPGDFLNYRIIPNVIKNCLLGKRPILFNGMTYTREFTYCEDLMQAFLLARNNLKSMSGQAYNVGSGEQRDQNGVINEILKHFTGVEPELREPEAYSRKEIPYQVLDSSKIRKLGWTPKFSFERGIAETVEWWRENEDIWNSKN